MVHALLSSRGSHWKQPLYSCGGRGKAVYILPSSDPTLALLLVGFTEYDDDDDEESLICKTCNPYCTLLSSVALTLPNVKYY
ncbi:hypothetical protein Hanom_Chr10g00892011 [Helianthus anomalus]